jgi:DNA-binding NtrC family response regulator
VGLDQSSASERFGDPFPEIVGRSPASQALRREMERIASSEMTVHIQGETGTGKERVARALHRGSRRARGPFVALNAAGFGDELFEAELFGHTRGAFTGAVAAREGYIAAADSGTLFIDEVGELSARAQAKLLRVLQEREYQRLGESVTRKADVRILSATNVDLAQRVAEGRFRRDLLYRLKVATLHVPPLRERGPDVLLLARQLIREAAARDRRAEPALTEEVRAALQLYTWPGNVRELQNEMNRLVVFAHGGPARVEHLSREVRGGVPPSGTLFLRRMVRDFERERVRQALERHGAVRAAAAELGITRQALYNKKRRFGL